MSPLISLTYVLKTKCASFPQVTTGLDTLLFNLLVLGVLKSSSGQVWRRRTSDLYVIELTTGPAEDIIETVHKGVPLFKASSYEVGNSTLTTRMIAKFVNLSDFGMSSFERYFCRKEKSLRELFALGTVRLKCRNQPEELFFQYSFFCTVFALTLSSFLTVNKTTQ